MKSFSPVQPAALPLPGTITGKYWLDGRIVDRNEAAIPLSDLALTRGYAAFDALRTYNNVPFLLEQHLRRLEKTCELLFLEVPLERNQLAEVVRVMLAANHYPESLVRIIVTGGDASGFTPENRERLLVLVDPLRTYPARQFEAGISLALAKLDRTLPLAKSTSYLAGVCETIQAKRQGFDEVVFCDADGSILEGTTFSVVAVRGRELISPREGVLTGITVEHLLGLAQAEGFTVTRAAISRAIWQEADEVFITSSTRELIPVNRIDDTALPQIKPDGATGRLHALYRRSVQILCTPATPR
jgi:branched-chain amino acid aminotransferase